MFKSSFAIKSSLAGLAMFGALVLVPQQASAGRFGGFHGGGFHSASTPHFVVSRPAFHPVFRPAYHPTFRPTMRFAPRHTMIGGYRAPYFGGARHERAEHLRREGGHERTRLGRLEHERGRHAHGRGGFAPALYQPDYSEPDTAGANDATPPTVYPLTGAASGAGPVAVGGAPASDKPVAGPTAATCSPGTGTGSAVEVTFADKATSADVTNFLKAYNVTIVDGPSKDNHYRVRLAEKSLPPNELMKAVQSMQSNTAIVSAVSVY